MLTDTPCIEWEGEKSPSGYGLFRIYTGGRKSRRAYLAHRLSYELLVGPIPEGLVIDHLCRNRLCVNPGHLEPVTNAENVLRGEGRSAQNARKTHCPKGHPLSGGNMRRNRKGNRLCKVCESERARRWRERAGYVAPSGWHRFAPKEQGQ